jgi:hypothetical protein
MEGVMTLLAHGGMLPQLPAPEGEKKPSPRRQGVKQGALLMLTGAVLVPALGVLYTFSDFNVIYFFICLAAVICFIGGPLRMLFAALFEEGAPKRAFVPPPAISYNQPQPTVLPMPSAPVASLPPPSANPNTGWRARPQTAEIFRPSVTDNTTQLLGKQDHKSEDIN